MARPTSLADSRLVSVAVLVVTTALILAGIWFVRGQQGTAAGAMSEVTLSAEQSAPAPKVGDAATDFTGLTIDTIFAVFTVYTIHTIYTLFAFY